MYHEFAVDSWRCQRVYACSLDVLSFPLILDIPAYRHRTSIHGALKYDLYGVADRSFLPLVMVAWLCLQSWTTCFNQVPP